MHSRIYQVSFEPVEEFINEFRYHSNFVPSVADYVVKQETEEQIREDLEWLAQATKGIEVDVENKTIKIVSKEEYFKGMHEKFVKLAEELSTITLEEFVNDKSYFKFYDLKSAYEDRHSFYIDDNDENIGYAPIDTWIRHTEDGEVYYIGSIFDYHF